MVDRTSRIVDADPRRSHSAVLAEETDRGLRPAPWIDESERTLAITDEHPITSSVDADVISIIAEIDPPQGAAMHPTTAPSPYRRRLARLHCAFARVSSRDTISADSAAASASRSGTSIGP